MSCKCKKCGASFTSKLALAFYAFFSLCCAKSFAQDCNYRLSIEVLDLHDGSPLMNALVMINELDIGGTTDYDGSLVFEDNNPSPAETTKNSLLSIILEILLNPFPLYKFSQ